MRHKRVSADRPVRYAVVGLGWIAQSAILPAFRNARRNSQIAALVSDDPAKLQKLGREYRVDELFSYDEFDHCLEHVDAVFIALPNTQHRAYAEAAALAGVHVLSEKPMAMTSPDCQAMIDTCRAAQVKLMIGYRLHFERASLAAIELVRKGELGEPRLFASLFTQDVQPGNLRLRKGEGGPLYDIGIYCLNAARGLFGSEPEEVTGWHAQGGDERFAECPEATSALLRFPGDRIASFSCSFGAPGTSSYEIVGSEATLRVSPAFSIGERLVHQLTRRGRTRTTSFPAGDQFAPELLYFSDCIREDREPEPSGEEGFADVRVLEAIEASAATGRSVELAPFEREARPSIEQQILRPAHGKAPLVHVQDPSPD